MLHIYKAGGLSAQLANPLASFQKHSFLGHFLVWTCDPQQGKLHSQGHCCQAGTGIQLAEASALCDQIGKLICL